MTLEREVNFLVQYNLTADELLFIKVLLLFQNEPEDILRANDMYGLIGKVMDTQKKNNLPPGLMIRNLQGKEIILKSWKIPKDGERFDPREIPLNKNFVKQLYRTSFEMGKELYEVYPEYANIDGSLVWLKSICKKFDSHEDCYFRYGRSINWNPETHERIVNLVIWANENRLLNSSFGNFIIDQRWTMLESLRNGDTVNVNYDTIKLI